MACCVWVVIVGFLNRDIVGHGVLWRAVACASAWKIDPVSGVIGVQN